MEWKKASNSSFKANFQELSDKSSAINFATRELLYFYCILRRKNLQLDVVRLSKILFRKIADMEVVLNECKCSSEEVNSIKFMICTLLDETLAYYVCEEDFAGYRSLTSYHYGEQLGGEHVFNLLEEALQDVKANFPILELGHRIICLGFTGQYALQKGGLAALNEIRDKIFFAIKPFLAEQKQSIKTGKVSDALRKIKRTMAPILALALLVAYIVLYQTLSQERKQLEELVQDSFGL